MHQNVQMCRWGMIFKIGNKVDYNKLFDILFKTCNSKSIKKTCMFIY